MKTMDNVKRKIITSMVAILLLIITIFGITYAYFMANLRDNDKDKSVSVNSGMLKLTYDDGNGELTIGDHLLPGKTVNFKDKDGNLVTEKTFSVKNTGTYLVDDYEVVVEKVVNELVNYEDLVYTLTCRTDKENGTCNGSTGVFPKTYSVLVTNSIDVDETQYYTLTMKFNETNKDQSVDMNKNISARINIQDNESSLKDLVIYGNSVQDGIPSETNPVLIQSVGDRTKNLFDKSNFILDSSSVIMFDASELVIGETYTLSSNKPISWFKISTASSGYNSVQVTDFENGFTSLTFKMARNSNISEDKKQYIIIGTDIGATPTFIKDISLLNDYNIQIEKGTTASDYEPYGYKVPLIVSGKNMFDIDNPNLYGAINTNVEKLDNGFKYTAQSNASYSSYVSYNLDEKIIAGKTITLSLNVLLSEGNTGMIRIGYWNNNNVFNYLNIKTITVNGKAEVTAEIPEVLPEDAKSGYCIFFNTAVYENMQGATFEARDIQVEIADSATKYETYIKSTYNIYLDEPLRKVGETTDYIDFMNYKVVRNVRVNDDTGTKTIDNSYSSLDIPEQRNVSLPNLIKESIGNIEIGTTIQPSKIEY